METPTRLKYVTSRHDDNPIDKPIVWKIPEEITLKYTIRVEYAIGREALLIPCKYMAVGYNPWTRYAGVCGGSIGTDGDITGFHIRTLDELENINERLVTAAETCLVSDLRNQCKWDKNIPEKIRRVLKLEPEKLEKILNYLDSVAEEVEVHWRL